MHREGGSSADANPCTQVGSVQDWDQPILPKGTWQSGERFAEARGDYEIYKKPRR